MGSPIVLISLLFVMDGIACEDGCGAVSVASSRTANGLQQRHDDGDGVRNRRDDAAQRGWKRRKEERHLLGERAGNEPVVRPASKRGNGIERERAGDAIVIGVSIDRESRRQRISQRLDARLQEGMADEIKGLLDSGVPAATLINYGLEYKYVTLYLTGTLDYASMREKLAISIHQFAKRQMTWFRGMERSGTVIHWTEVH